MIIQEQGDTFCMGVAIANPLGTQNRKLSMATKPMSRQRANPRANLSNSYQLSTSPARLSAKAVQTISIGQEWRGNNFESLTSYQTQHPHYTSAPKKPGINAPRGFTITTHIQRTKLRPVLILSFNLLTNLLYMSSSRSFPVVKCCSSLRLSTGTRVPH